MYYCTAPLYNCQDQEILIDYYNTTEDGLEQCNHDRKRRVAARIYLGAAVFNAIFVIVTTLIFIYCAAGRTTVICNDDLSPKELRKLRKRQSIQKRSVSATTLGAFGHLVFSTCMFLTQAFNNDVGCQLMLWGAVYGFYTWIFAFTLRAYRLRYLLRLNQLKVKYLRMSTAERLACINDEDYQWYLKRTRKKKYLMVRPYCIYLLSIIVILVITLPSELMAMQAYGACYVRWGSTLLVSLYAFFICILVPFMLWYLRNYSDSHGIRTEVWVDAIVGIPFFILYFVWFILNTYDYEALSIYVSKTFGPGNWVILFTITAHFCSVVFPIIAYIPIESKFWLQFQCKCRKAVCRLQRFLHYGSARKQRDAEGAMAAMSIIPELSMESLERTLADPEMMRQLQDLAIRDFSSENVIFYEKYLRLEEKFKSEFLLHKDNPKQSSTSKNWINSLTKKPPTIPFITHMPTTLILNNNNKDQSSDDASEKEDGSFTIDKNQVIYNKFMSIPIPYKMYPDIIRLYEVFIKEDAPIQVNISFRARHTLDEAFHVLYQKHPELRPKEGSIVTYANTNMLYLNNVENDDDDQELDNTAEKIDTDRIQISHYSHTDPLAELNFHMFEPARIEVCWNIFNSVYPKLVEMHSVDRSLTD
ncbi:hypothetical protein MAM1_0224d08324 [Mucor ambiguus]|uniref:RGS domain-containing protein n=1 Tax=Mucor ambiguus TaxID=91626 RepID=A0A0C9N2K4_9FUNG|nr:hypothetical protein MAM1_0224d08324 [Mucor ambiguus]